ncbi:MAG: hypothetical protein CM1200mP22_23450 [Dehalococcoidia bacterium]|nr:MAG: hypothetical protein CM1200mP22_23450 [Dehalococcoidia bacterium]
MDIPRSSNFHIFSEIKTSAPALNRTQVISEISIRLLLSGDSFSLSSWSTSVCSRLVTLVCSQCVGLWYPVRSSISMGCVVATVLHKPKMQAP